MKYKLRCVSCKRIFAADPMAMTCPDCGPVDGTLDVVFPLEGIKLSKDEVIARWRSGRSVFEIFSDIFPFSNIADLPALRVGRTPFFISPRLCQFTGIPRLWIKDDSANPSASFKDRASAVAVAMAKQAGAKVIAAASTGNAASSLAAMAAAGGLKAVVFVPQDAPQAKLIQMRLRGALVVRLTCNYDQAFDLCLTACHLFHWYCRNTAINPFTGEGKKSAALEIACDLDDAPNAVFCPVGDGCIISGLHKGFSDLHQLGLISRPPRLFGVQASGAAPLVRAFEAGERITPLSNPQTVADSIRVGFPRDSIKALRAVRESGGAMIAVSDEEILQAQRILANQVGIFAEPAACASLAGVLQALKRTLINPSDTVVLLITGHGLKDIENAVRNAPPLMEPIAPDLDAVGTVIDRWLNVSSKKE